jgi:hypothetical protein
VKGRKHKHGGAKGAIKRSEAAHSRRWHARETRRARRARVLMTEAMFEERMHMHARTVDLIMHAGRRS